MPPERARLVASAAYTLARAAHADLEITAEESAVIEQELQTHGALDEPTAVLVAEMAKLQAKTVGGTEDYVVTREFTNLATEQQRMDVLRACFVVGAASGAISAEESCDGQPDRQRARAGPGCRLVDPSRVPRAAVVGPGGPPGRRPGLTGDAGAARRPPSRSPSPARSAAPRPATPSPCAGRRASSSRSRSNEGERFRVLLTDPVDQDAATGLLDGVDGPGHPERPDRARDRRQRGLVVVARSRRLRVRRA